MVRHGGVYNVASLVAVKDAVRSRGPEPYHIVSPRRKVWPYFHGDM